MRVVGKIRLATLALLSLLAVGVVPAESRAANGRLRVLYAEPVTIEGLASPPGRASFDAYGRRFELVLESNDRLLAGLDEADRSAISGVRLLRGSLAGVPSSWVRLAIDGERQTGMVWDGRELYVIEPAIEVAHRAVNPLGVAGRKPVVYRLSDTQSDAGAATCQVVVPDRTAAKASGLDEYRALVGSLKQAAEASGLAGRLQVSAIADYEFYQFAGSAEAARSRIATLFNDVDGIYSAQVGIQIELAGTITVFQDPADPFTSPDPSTLLDELSEHRRSQSSLSSTGVTHLVTGRDLSGSTVGIAYLSALCLSRYGASLSQGTASLVALIAAHEIGHNFGAPHDGEAAVSGQPANPCEPTPRTFLMAPQLNGSDQFSQCSLTQMQPEIDAATCILPVVATADLALSSTATSTSTNTGQPIALRASVVNRGTAEATNVQLSFTVPGGLVVIDGTATNGGTCATQAGGIACAWPTLGAGVTSNVTLNLRADAAGSYAVPAALVATGDASTGNDALDFQVTATAPGTAPPPAPAGNGGGGGGSLGGFALASFLALLATRRARDRRAIRTGSP